jgi:hypothetical protein
MKGVSSEMNLPRLELTHPEGYRKDIGQRPLHPKETWHAGTPE